MLTAPATTGTKACATATKRTPSSARAPRPLRNALALAQLWSPSRWTSRLNRIRPPNRRPIRSPIDSPSRDPSVAAPISRANRPGVVTVVAASSTTASPGTIRPTSIEVSSTMNRLVSRYRLMGGTAASQSRSCWMSSVMAGAPSGGPDTGTRLVADAYAKWLHRCPHRERPCCASGFPLECPPDLVGQVVDGKRAGRQHRAVRLAPDPAGVLVEFVVDLPDQLLQQVLDGHDALDAAVLVDHDGELLPLGLEAAQRVQHAQRLRQVGVGRTWSATRSRASIRSTRWAIPMTLSTSRW